MAQLDHFLFHSPYPQAHDIIRTWAFYTIVKTAFAEKTIPWSTIVISGHVTQGNGKLSKSTGGGKLTPESLLTQLGRFNSLLDGKRKSWR